MKSTLLGIFSLMGVITVWSSWVISSRWGLLESPLQPMDLMILRFSFAGLAMAPLLWSIGLGGLRLRDCLILALGAGPGYTAFAYTGLLFAPAAHGSALTAGMLPLFTMVLGAALGITKITPLRMLGLVLLVLAAIAFFLDGQDPSRSDAWIGDLILLGGPLMWSIYTIKVQSSGVNAMRATAIVSVFGLLIFAPIYAVFGNFENLVEAGLVSAISQGIFHGWVVVIGSLTLFTFAVRTLGAAVTTMATATVPAITAVAASILLDEPFTQMTAIGVALDAAGLVCVAIALMRIAKQPSSIKQS